MEFLLIFGDRVMEIKLFYEGIPNVMISHEIQELGKIISEECDADVCQDRTPVDSVKKSDGLVIGISIASLAISGLSAFIAVLKYWRSSHPRYSISVLSGDYEISISNLKKERLLSMYNELVNSGQKKLAFKIRSEQENGK
jgi:hypothetical protein